MTAAQRSVFRSVAIAVLSTVAGAVVVSGPGVVANLMILPAKVSAIEQRVEAVEKVLPEIRNNTADAKRDAARAARQSTYISGWVAAQPGAPIRPMSDTNE